MTKAIEVDNIKDLEELLLTSLPFSQVRFGSSFCEELLPTVEEVERALEACSSKNIPLAIVTPFVSNKGLNQVLRIAQMLKGTDHELVVNDWGVLYYLSKSNLSLTAGRLLARSKGDPRISQVWDKLPQERKTAYRKKALLSPIRLTRLANFGVKAVEIDIPPWGVELPHDIPIKILVHQPLCYLTVSRHCPTRMAREKKPVFSEPCLKPCLDLLFKLWHNATGELILRGNACFTKSGQVNGFTTITPYWLYKNRKISEAAVASCE